MKKIAIISIVLWINLTVLWVCVSKIQRLTKERDRLGDNVESLMTESQRYKLDSTTMVNESTALQLTIQELKRYRNDDAELIKKLQVKNKQLEAISKQVVTIETKFEAPVKDTVIIRDSIPVMAQQIRYKDPFIEIEATILEKELLGSIKLKTTLKQVLYHEYKRKFLFFHWGRGKVRQAIVCDNPYVEIEYQDYIEIKKK